MKFSLIPREQKFFDLFEEGAHNLVEAGEVFTDLVENWENVEEKVSKLEELEHKGDSITHRITALLHSTFVTPFDREDIALLTNAIDDVLDLIHGAADTMLIYRVQAPTQRAKELAEIIRDGVAEVERAVKYLRHRGQLKLMLVSCVELNRLENAADEVLKQALGELFQDASDMVQVIKWRELYEHMEDATDRCEDVANILEGIVLKHA
ncbi:MAG: DUF47 family protein [Chloroflexi bacterium]|nr:DUF47 family protein [Chloroflexota bacterium]